MNNIRYSQGYFISVMRGCGPWHDLRGCKGNSGAEGWACAKAALELAVYLECNRSGRSDREIARSLDESPVCFLRLTSVTCHASAVG